MIVNFYLLFTLFIVFFVFPIGKVFLQILKIKLPFWEDLLIGINIGIVFLIVAVYASSVLGLGKAFYLLPIVCLLLLLSKATLFQKKDTFLKINYKLLVILVIVTLISAYFTFFSEQLSFDKLRLIGGNAHDGLWHLALIESLKKGIPPQNPIFANSPIQNYHYLTDILIAVTAKTTNIPTLILYFKIIEPFFVLLFSATIFLFVKRLTMNNAIAYFSVPFIVLSSNMFYIVRIFYPNAYFSPSALWVDEFVTKMVNPQLLLSYIVILTLLYLILIYEKLGNYKFIFIASVIGASLLGIKSYGFVVFILSLSLFSLVSIVNKNFKYIKLSGGLILTSSLLYLSSNISKENIFILSPFWFIKSMFETSDHLNYSTWELKRQTYLEHKNYLRIFQLYFEGTTLFLLGNLGSRLIGIFAIFGKMENRKKEIVYILCFISIISMILPFVFIQKGIVWNSIQYFYYSILSLGILSSISLGILINKHKRLTLLLAGLLWALLLPGVIYGLFNYYPWKNSSYYPPYLIKAANFLKDQPEGVILLNPKYADDSVVPAISGKAVYFADETILSIQLVDFKSRKQEVESFFNGMGDNINKEYLIKNSIKYILTENRTDLFHDSKFGSINGLNLHQIYGDNEIIIYKLL